MRAARYAQLARQFAPTVGGSLVSQGVSALALIAIPLVGSAASDSYAVAIQTGSSAFTSVGLGLVYNLAVGRPNFSNWTLWGILGSVFSLALGAYTVFFLPSPNGLPAAGAHAIIIIFSVGGAALLWASIHAIRMACRGKPVWLVVSTVLPNAGLLAGELLVRGSIRTGGPLPPQTPALFWTALAIISWFWFRHRDRSMPSLMLDHENQHEDQQIRQHTIGLILGLIASGIVPIMLISAAARLPAGSAAVILIISRIGTSIVTLTVDSILLVRYNWMNQSRGRVRYPLWTLACSVAFGTAALILHISRADVVWSYVAVGVSWSCALIASAIAVREGNARRSGTVLLWKAVVDVGTALFAAVLLLRTPSFTGYFAAYMMSQFVTTGAISFVYRSTALLLLSLGAAALAMVLLLFGW